MKLTNAKREAIIEKCIKNHFEPIQEKIEKEMAEYCESIIKKEIEGKPFAAVEGYFAYTQHVLVKKERTSYYRDSVEVRLSKAYPKKLHESYSFIISEHKQLEKLYKKYMALKDEIQSKRNVLNSILHSVTTDKKLISLLPEIEPVIVSLFGSDREKNELLPVSVQVLKAVKDIL